MSNLKLVAIPSPTASTLTDTLLELKDLWSSTNRALEASRESLYGFLGVTYERAASISLDNAALTELRSIVRRAYESDRDKKRVASASAEELLLVAALGIPQGSLRSKYKRLLATARDEGVPADRDSFRHWLKRTGGIVNALRDAIDESAPATPSRSSAARSFDSCAGDLLRNRASNPVEERAFTKEPHRGFVLALFYVDPQTKQVRLLAELNDGGLIEQAVRLATDEQCQLAERREAA
jgi:hypothetical protein